jgi:hypothetical protein
MLDEMLRICVEKTLVLTGNAGTQACADCAAGKSPARMTMGQRVQVLVMLDRDLANAVADGSRRRSRLLGKQGVRLLEAIAKSRNSFTHDEESPDIPQVEASVLLVRKLCDLELISVLGSDDIYKAPSDNLA